jgi:HEAT repeat protein
MSLFGPPNVEKLKEKHNIPGLLKALEYHKDPQIVRAAAVALGQLGANETLAALAALADNPNPAIREGVFWSLGKLGDPNALDLLLAALDDPDESARKAALQGLALLGHPDAIAPLVKLLKSCDNDARSGEVAQALGQLGKTLEPAERQTRIVEPIAPLLLARNKQTRADAAQALDTMGWQPDQSTTAAAYWLAKDQWERCLKLGELAAPPLITTLKDDNIESRQRAFQALVNLGKPGTPALVEALNDNDTEIRQAAFAALTRIGPPARDALLIGLTNENDRVRLMAVKAIAQLNDPETVIPLIALFRDIDWTIRGEAYKAIVKTGKAALKPLTEALHHENEEIQWGAAGTLEALGWKPADDELGAVYWMVKGEWHRCSEIGAPAVRPLIGKIDHWDDTVCRDAIGALTQIGAPAVEPLIATLKAETPRARKNAAVALGMIGNERAEAPLMELLSERDKEVSKAASEAISAIQTGEVWRGSS